jgi:diguanylate cyclase (GGDEF)-like protein/PAS domain S-box-containing protein
LSGANADLATAVIHLLDDGVWVIDPETSTVIEVNPAGAARMGLTPGDLLGRPFRDLLEPAMPAEGWRLLVDHAGGGRRHRVPVQLRAGGGHVVAVDLTVVRHRTVAHDVLLVTARDRTARTHDEERLRVAHDLLGATIDALEEGVAVVDPGGRIEHVNEAFCRLVGLPADRLLDRSVFDPPWVALDESGRALSPETSAAALCLRRGAEVQGDTECVQLSRADRSWFRTTARPLDGPTTTATATATAGPRPGAGPDGSAPRTAGAVVVLHDQAETVRTEAALRHLLHTDSLTGLWSRVRINEHLESAVRDPASGSLARVGVLHVDLDNFRMVNDTFGAAVGDTVLAEVARRLRELHDRRLEIGRVGVDEFLVVLSGDGPSLTFDAELRRLAEDIQRRLQRPVAAQGLEVRLTASVGVARSPGDAHTAVELLAAADRALAAGRLDGRSRLRFYESTLDEATRTGLALDRDLRRAAASRSLEVHYQPIIDLRTGGVAMAEALVRWHHPDQGPIPPSVFIPTAEATGAIGAVSDVVISTVAEDIATWTREDVLPPQARIAINVSPTEFEQRDFTERLATTLGDAGVSPAQIELEITESLLVQDLGAAAARLEELDSLGFLIALDDFGTGYSSLSYLHTLPFHTLKIDRRFVNDLRDGRSGTITRAILTLAHNLGIVAVAEGVETDVQRGFLYDAGCDLVQGFYYAPPLPRPAFERFLHDHRTVEPPLLRSVS